MSVNSVHQNIEALKGWFDQLNKGKKKTDNKKIGYAKDDTKAKK